MPLSADHIRPAVAFVVRACAPEDMPAIRAIYADAVLHGTASFELEPPDLAEMVRRREAIVGAGYPYLVAEHDGAVVGYAYAGAFRPRPAYRFTVENSIYVAPDRKGQGIGRALLKALLVEVEARGFRQVMAVIGDSGNAPSIKLHEACGFTLVGIQRSVGFKHGRWLDSVIMQRAVGAGDTSLPA